MFEPNRLRNGLTDRHENRHTHATVHGKGFFSNFVSYLSLFLVRYSFLYHSIFFTFSFIRMLTWTVVMATGERGDEILTFLLMK